MATPSKPQRGARIGAAQKLKKAMLSTRPNPFTTLVENTVDAYTASGDGAVEDVRRILADLRRQYDEVHNEGERKEQECLRLREAVRQAESNFSTRSEDAYKYEDQKVSLSRQLEETTESITEALTNRKVYQHMLERLKKERALLKQELVQMEAHLTRKQSEHEDKLAQARLAKQHQAQAAQELELTEQDGEHERSVREGAMRAMMGTLHTKRNAIQRRADFERWRHEVALEAANEAFQSSAGRLRKLYAVEKLAGNCLQKIIFEQVEKSQATEDGFQKIREVTGLTDVMDIVHKFLNRDVEHEQLKSAVAEAESKLESLLADFEQYKRQTEGIVPQDTAGSQRGIYQEVEDVMGQLQQKLKSHANAKDRLHKLTLAFEDVKRWGKRFHDSMRPIVEEECALDTAQEVVKYFQGLVSIIQHFTQHALTPATTKKRLQQARDEKAAMAIQNCKANFRINLDHKENTNAAKEDPDGLDSVFTFNNDRNKFKDDSNKFISEAMRRTQKEKKQRGHAA